jgi:hypothetical protein
VYDAALMGDRQTLGELAAQREALKHRQRLARQALRQIFSLEPLHRQKRDLCAGDAVRKVVHDLGMAQLGQELGLAQEALERERRFFEAAWQQDLDRHTGPGLQIPGFEHLPHAAAARQALQTKSICEDLANYRARCTDTRHDAT